MLDTALQGFRDFVETVNAKPSVTDAVHDQCVHIVAVWLFVNFVIKMIDFTGLEREQNVLSFQET
jgi:hypothetical protein